MKTLAYATLAVTLGYTLGGLGVVLFVAILWNA